MRFWRNESGATLIYITLIIGILVGIAGLSLDSGRIINLKHEVQAAADAAALAGAWQLDGSLTGSQNADVAARSTPVVTNNQRFGDTPGTATIASTAFYNTIPADDDTALSDLANAAGEYNYIEVTATGVAQSTTLMRFLGAAATTTVNAKAVARKGQSRCQQTPLFMCLPGGASFDPTQWLGHQVLMKASQGNSWTNGNWGLLDTPGGSQSAGALASMIAGVNGLPQCIGTGGVDTKPGNVASISAAFNVRMDVYENLPGNVNYQATPGYPPAEHVLKGTNGTLACTARPTWAGGSIPRGFPRDSDISDAVRFGNGQWDCLTYWNQAHPGDTANMPGACSSTGGMTRYEMYLHEITSQANRGLVPDLTSLGSDNGDPNQRSPSACYTGGPIPPTPTALSQRINDRRIFVVAGVDCSSIAINGNTPNVPVQHWISMFLTEPAGTQGQTNGDVYMEIVGHESAGGGGLVPVQLREWVELVR